MKKDLQNKPIAGLNEETSNLTELVDQVRTLVSSARRSASQSINYVQTHLNFEIGRLIVEHEQQGDPRAKYGKHVLDELSERLTLEIGKGFSRQNLQNMRSFFLIYKDRSQKIRQTPSGKLLDYSTVTDIVAIPSADVIENSKTTITGFTLSWSHYVLLIGTC